MALTNVSGGPKLKRTQHYPVLFGRSVAEVFLSNEDRVAYSLKPLKLALARAGHDQEDCGQAPVSCRLWFARDPLKAFNRRKYLLSLEKPLKEYKATIRERGAWFLGISVNLVSRIQFLRFSDSRFLGFSASRIQFAVSRFLGFRFSASRC